MRTRGFRRGSRRAALVAAFALAAGTAGPASAGPDGSADTARTRGEAISFLRGVIGDLAANRYAAAWTTLAPAQQRLLPRATYVRCESLSPVPGRLTRIVAVESRSERVTVPGSPARSTSSIVVRFSLVLTGEADQGSVTVPVTAHALRLDDGWAWMLPAKRLRLHRMPNCGQPTTGNPALSV